MQCPHPECSLAPSLGALESLLPAERWQAFHRLLVQRYVDANPTLKWCPRPDCQSTVDIQPLLRSNPCLAEVRVSCIKTHIADCTGTLQV